VTALYYGHLHPQHLDFPAIDALANARPDWRVILLGPSRIDRPFPPNVERAGQVRHDELARWIAQADVLLLPYLLNAYTRSVMPAKTYECLATGRPIIAAPLPELTAGFAEQLTFAYRPDEWAPAIDQALRGDTEGKRVARIELAKQNSWSSRYAEIRRLLAV
jgi:glycosyltransferase involved in cell wall biosynthesis